MHSKFKWIIPLVLILLLLAGWRIWSTSDTFASGASVDQWNLGGLSKEEATQLLRQEASAEPLRIQGPQNIQVSIRTKPLAQAAVDKAWEDQDRNILDRVLGTGSGRASMEWSYSSKEINKIAKRVLSWNRPARNASVSWQGDNITVEPARTGWQVDGKHLRKELAFVARSGGGPLIVRGKKIDPEIASRQELWKRQPAQILVDQSEFKLFYYKHGKLQKTYSVAVGQPGFETPNGQWKIINRAVDPAWMAPEWAGAQAGTLVPGGSPDNPLIDRWLGIGDGVGIHGTAEVYSLGSAASHGCIRMDPADVRELYEWIPVGTPVLIRS